jgi:hypothetical protein
MTESALLMKARARREAAIERLTPPPVRDASPAGPAQPLRSLDYEEWTGTAPTPLPVKTPSQRLVQAVTRREAAIRRGAVPAVVYRPPGSNDWRATPNPQECSLIAAGNLPPGGVKLWDRSPVDQNSFDPFEPPSQLPDPPANLTPPTIVLFDTLEVGHTVAGQTGGWSGSPSFARQWLRDGVAIPGETSPGYVLAAADVGLMIGLDVVATNAGGSATANASEVGPVIEAAP